MYHVKKGGVDIFLTKECDYGIRMIRSLAKGEKKTVQGIVETEKIPLQYAYKILKKLEKGGFVSSIRGRDGGYVLKKALSSYSLYDVATSIENNLFVFECLHKKDACIFREAEQPCRIHCEFERIQKVLIDELTSKSMAEVLLKKEA